MLNVLKNKNFNLFTEKNFLYPSILRNCYKCKLKPLKVMEYYYKLVPIFFPFIQKEKAMLVGKKRDGK